MDTRAALASTLAVGRVGMGLAGIVAPVWFGGIWVGRAARRADVGVMVRAFGVRDVALGLATLGALRAGGSDGPGFRALTTLGIGVDVVDTASTLAARDDIPNAGFSAGVAAAAAATGAAVLALGTPDD